MDWIFDNKEWLFSGVGVTIIVLIGRYLIRRLRARQSSAPVPPATPPAPAALPDATSITPQHIGEAIDASPLLLQPDVMRQYAGIRVSWEGTLLHMTKPGQHSISLTLMSPRSRDRTIVFDVAPSAYPGLGLLKQGATIKVRGVIKNIDPMSIYLRDAEMKFNP